MDDDEIIAIAADELNVEFDDMKRFLNSESGCYTDMRDWNNNSIWMSGEMSMRLLRALVENT